ncbi:MAG: hypothetical protein LH478_06945 [Chitinophagaceae bacterium]|nr:hypothetical protein [Chitinophagaceae bacterium]
MLILPQLAVRQLLIIRRLCFIITLFAAILITARNGKEKEVIVTPVQAKVVKRENGAAKDIFNPAFNILFLRNYNSKPDSNQLEMFLTKLNNKPQLVVFQFFHTDQNELTLAAFGGKQNHRDFDKYPFVPILEVSDWQPSKKIDLTGKNVFFSNQEIGKKQGKGPDPLKVLESIINKPGYAYITFTPRLIPGDEPNKYFIVYDIGYMNSLPTAAIHAAGAVISSLSLSLNPSPPRSSFSNTVDEAFYTRINFSIKILGR